MSKINNSGVRGPMRPMRTGDLVPEKPETQVGDGGLGGIEAPSPRPLPPVAPRRGQEDREDEAATGGAGQDSVDAIRSIEMPVVGLSRISSKSPVSSMAIAELIGSLEQQGREAVHRDAITVLRRLKALVDQVAERRAWPRIPRLRRRQQRRRREG